MAAGPWIVYNDFKLAVYQKKCNLGSDTFKIVLLTSASNVADKTLSPARYADLTNELSTANGYTAGGLSLASPTLTGGGAIDEIDWDTGPAVWNITGAGITCRYAAIYDDTATDDDLVAYCLLDSTPANIVQVAGFQFTVAIANVFGNA